MEKKLEIYGARSIIEAINANQNIDKVKSKISEDLSPTKKLAGIHLKIVATIAIIWSLSLIHI